MQIRIDDASYDQLLIAAEVLALDAKRGITKKEDLRALVRAAVAGNDTIEVPGDEAPAVVVARSNSDSAHHSNDPKVVINIASDDATGGSHPFPVSNNGVMLLLKRDTEVEIPYRHYLVLNDAVETILEPYTDQQTGQPKVRETKQHAVRFTVKRLPSEAEIAAFHERTRNIKAGGMRKAA